MVYVSVVSGVIILVSKQGRCVAALCWRARSRGRASIFFFFFSAANPQGYGDYVLRDGHGGAGEYTINVYVYHRTTTAKLPLLPMIHIEGRTGRVDPDETENDDENGCSAARWGEKVTLGRS